MSKKQVIVVVSFGTTYVEALNRCIVPIEEAVATAFPSYRVVRAITSAFVRGRLAEHGIEAESLPNILARLYEEGYREVIVAPTHIIAGEEYRDKVVSAVDAYRDRFESLTVGRPLMMCSDRSAEYDDLVQALCSQFPQLGAEDVVVLMGHGSRGADNSVYLLLQEAFADRSETVVVGILESCDILSLDTVMERLATLRSVKKVHLMPFLVVAGSHAAKDMQEWQARIQAAGYQTEAYLYGLGENAAIRELYVERIRKITDKTE